MCVFDTLVIEILQVIYLKNIHYGMSYYLVANLSFCRAVVDFWSDRGCTTLLSVHQFSVDLKLHCHITVTVKILEYKSNRHTIHSPLYSISEKVATVIFVDLLNVYIYIVCTIVSKIRKINIINKFKYTIIR